MTALLAVPIVVAAAAYMAIATWGIGKFMERCAVEDPAEAPMPGCYRDKDGYICEIATITPNPEPRHAPAREQSRSARCPRHHVERPRSRRAHPAE